MDLPSPTISIGMPVFNGAAHLGEALDSILRQSFADFELIISDNCSTDGTAEIISKYAARDPRIRDVRQDENIGGLPNFRFVLEAARADFFMWAAYDDWHDANYLEALHRPLAENSDLHMAVPRIVRVRPDGSEAEVTEIPSLDHLSRLQRVKRMLSLSRGGTIYGLYRTDAIRAAYNRAERDFPYVWAADHLTIFPFLVNDRATGVPETTFYNRDTGMSEGRYRPMTAGQLWPYMGRFLWFSAREVLDSRLNSGEKIMCLAYLLPYANGKAVKWRRLLTRTLRAPFGTSAAPAGNAG